MRQIFAFLLVLILITACTQTLEPSPEIETEANVWQRVGNSFDGSYNFDLANDSQDNPYIASALSNNSLYIHKWDGNQWLKIGNALGTVLNLEPVSIVIGSDNKPFVAWFQSFGELYVSHWDGTNWQSFGGNLVIKDISANSLSLAIDRTNLPIVAWVESGDIYVKRWDGENWVQLSGILDFAPVNESFSPTIAIGQDNKPFVAWIENENLYVKTWNGSKWILLGSFVEPQLHNWVKPHLVIDRENRPLVIWEDTTGKSNVIVKRWNGITWEQMGDKLEIDSNNYVNDVSLSIGRNGKPIVAWHEVGRSPYSSEQSNLYVKRWDGTQWIKIGLPVNTNVLYDGGLTLDVLSNNVPNVSWLGTNLKTFERGVFVYKRVGDEWLQRGHKVDWDFGGSSRNSSLILRGSNRPTLAFQHGQYDIIVKSWTNEVYQWGAGFIFYGKDPSMSVFRNSAPILAYCIHDTSNNVPGRIYVQYAKILSSTSSNGIWNWEWLYLGDVLNKNSENDAQHPSISVGTDNKPVVTWQENNGTSWDVFVKRWDGTSWVQIGDSLDISLAANAQHPVIDIGTDNNPVVAWYEETATTSRIYAKRWDGTQWVQLGGFVNIAGSKKAYMPSLALDSLNNPVVSWHEASTTSNNVYAKRWDAVSGSWVRLGTLLDIASSANAENPSVQVGVNDYPTVAWQEAGNVYVKSWNGTTWIQVSKAVDVNLADNAANPSLVLRADGKPVVAWDESNSTTSNIYVKRY
jgi:hypothetical protein